jgi:hypothetical protein
VPMILAAAAMHKKDGEASDASHAIASKPV